ncbi:fluoride efflux transporter CrcB [Kroppenstedtia pulmonis]|uniref:Fluoride-specific ion channel FluC n=1 Tax=Kroppenstedtia pulmonis TaxID=1380685 RepID=A0A7D4CLX5_9BACL|nr:fluoride efflux transporter CrcB [Kroppenstedtia pulmonis]QKG84158.1 fluoride efflux transporter CrcB [Kroppenstedtia pulmonis]
MNYWIVGIAGMAGALLRHYTSLFFEPLPADSFPVGTLLVNYIGSFILSWLNGKAGTLITPRLQLAIGTGLIGSFTTFSTFSIETIQLWEQDLWGKAVLYVLFSIWGGWLLASAGWKVSQLSDRDKREGEKR